MSGAYPYSQKTRNHRSSSDYSQAHGKAGDRWPIQVDILPASWHSYPGMEESIFRDSSLSRFAHGCWSGLSTGNPSAAAAARSASSAAANTGSDNC
jgi:hypothetical protein